VANKDRVEYYSKKGMVAWAESSIVPAPGSFISIRGKTWEVESVSYALDHSDNPLEKAMRANVGLISAEAGKGGEQQ
jgi:hypothetical protein